MKGKANPLLDLPDEGLLPHSEESERAVLGAVLLDPDYAWSRIRGRLAPEDFHLPRHEVLYRAICDLHSEGTPADLRTLQALLEQRGQFDLIGGISYLATLDLDLPDIGRLDHYVEIVAERSRRRAMLRLASEVIRDSLGTTDVEDTLGRLQGQVPALLASAARPQLRSMKAILPGLMEEIEERPEVLRGIPTGFDRFDDLTAGLRPGNLIIIAGRPGLGKTALAANIALNLSHRQHRPVGLWSLEMTEQELTLRLICSEADVPSDLVKKNYLSQQHWQRLVKATRELAEAPLYIDDSGSLTIAQLEGRIRRGRDELGLKAAVIDYLQLVQGGGRFEARNLEVAHVSQRLKGMAKDLGIPIIALSQLNREVTKRAGNRPTLADLKESGAIEADADLVVFVHREHAYDPEAPRGAAELIVAKQRNGATGAVPVLWVGETTTFRNLPPGSQATATVGEEPF